METGYQRSKFRKKAWSTKQVSTTVACHCRRKPGPNRQQPRAPTRSIWHASTEQKRRSQIERLSAFKKRHAAHSQPALDRLKRAAIRNENVFAQLMDTVRVCSLGQITDALFESEENTEGICSGRVG